MCLYPLAIACPYPLAIACLLPPGHRVPLPPAIMCFHPSHCVPPLQPGYHMLCSLMAITRPTQSNQNTGNYTVPLHVTTASSSSFHNSSTAVPRSFAEAPIYSCRGLFIQQQEVCLGRHPHRTIECTAKQTWDKKFETCAEHIRKGLWAKDGKQLCTTWQREEGCTTPKHDVRHACSGCRATTHGAQRCPRAQKADTADAWEQELRRAGLLGRFAKIPNGLRLGFEIDFPPVSVMQVPPNKSSITEYQNEFESIIRKKLDKGRYIGPFRAESLEGLIGPFQSSPLSIIPKPGKPGKFRIVQNFSFPASPNVSHPNPSINSYINASDFPTTWGKFSNIYLIIASRTIPLRPSQWPAGIVRVSDSHFCIDTCTAFGATPSAGVYGHIADAGAEIAVQQ